MSLSHHFVQTAYLIGHPSRALMLDALIGCPELTVTELADIAEISIQTASVHLSKLAAGRLVTYRQDGKMRRYSLYNRQVMQILQSLAEMANKPEQHNSSLVRFRVCYGHMAGKVGVSITDALSNVGLITLDDTNHEAILTAAGVNWLNTLGIDVSNYPKESPLCLDWTEKKWHISGWLGHELLSIFIERGWVRTVAYQPRGLTLTEAGQNYLDSLQNKK